MTEVQGLAYFPGVVSLVEATITLSHGISPSVAQLTIAPQLNFAAEGGPLTFAFGNTTVVFPGCKVDSASLERNGQGEVWRLSLFDRRWRWKSESGGGQISGSYNARHDDGALKTGGFYESNEKTPQQLAALCLEAMGESGFDVSALPNDARPFVEWDYDNPAEALANLCDDLGCRVVLGIDNVVRIHRIGVGAGLPQSGILEDSLTIDPPERPDKITVVGGPNLYQVDFELEAVGLDTDHQIKRLSDLSYKPSSFLGEWAKVDLPYFTSLGTVNSIAKNHIAELAKQTVWKWYRVKVPVTVGDYGQVEHLGQLILYDFQLEMVSTNGVKRHKEAAVFGIWFPGLDQRKNSTDTISHVLDTTADAQGGTKTNAVYRRPFHIDTDRHLVIFQDPVFMNTSTPSSSGGEPLDVIRGDARIFLRTTCSVRDALKRSLVRYERQRATGGNFGTQARYLKHDEIVRTAVPNYTPSGFDGVTLNDAEITPLADAYLDAAQQEYQATLPQSIKYAGLRLVNVDGAIQQVTFSVGPQGTVTMASRNSEAYLAAPSFHERRATERASRLPDLIRFHSGARAGGR